MVQQTLASPCESVGLVEFASKPGNGLVESLTRLLMVDGISDERFFGN